MGQRRDIKVTEQLSRLTAGDCDALIPEIYEELRSIAKSYVRKLHQGHSLDPVNVVSEAWIRLSASHPGKWTNRAQFFGYASRAMRFVVRDYCRTRGARKRGGGLIRIDLDAVPVGTVSHDIAFEDLYDCLEQFAAIDAEGARIVEMRFFGGLTVPEVSEALEISEATVKRRSEAASAWFKVQLIRK